MLVKKDLPNSKKIQIKWEKRESLRIYNTEKEKKMFLCLEHDDYFAHRHENNIKILTHNEIN